MDKSHILLTYIIVTWNSEKEIVDCLKSIQKYTTFPYEVYVVDNASSDCTVGIIKTKYKNIKLIESRENLGFAKANNLALEAAQGDYVCFINPDTILIEDIATPSIELLDTQPNIGLVAVHLCNKDMSWQPSCFAYAHGLSLFCEILHINRLFNMKNNGMKTYSPDWVIGAEMIMRRKEAVAVNGFSTEYYMYSEDMDLCKKIDVVLNKSIIYLANIKMVHLGGASESQNVSYNKQKKMFSGKLHFNEKFYGKSAAISAGRIMEIAYYVRIVLIFLFYWKKERKTQIGKTKQGIEVLKEVLKEQM